MPQGVYVKLLAKNGGPHIRIDFVSKLEVSGQGLGKWLDGARIKSLRANAPTG